LGLSGTVTPPSSLSGWNQSLKGYRRCSIVIWSGKQFLVMPWGGCSSGYSRDRRRNSGSFFSSAALVVAMADCLIGRHQRLPGTVGDFDDGAPEHLVLAEEAEGRAQPTVDQRLAE
jgi:hypothetical protein